MKKIYTLLFLFLGFFAKGQELLKDITTSNASSHPRYMVETANGTKFFIVGGLNWDYAELWKTDGTSAGTTLVMDGTPISNESVNIESIIGVIGNKVLFRANIYTYGTELWVTDGTAAGTQMLKDINTGGYSSYPSSFTSVGNKFIFTANDGTNGTELWVTDGTSAGTQLLKDIEVGSYGIDSYNFTYRINNNKLYFTVYNSTYGSELWVTDGTPSGTFLLKDIYSGNSSSFAGNLTNVGSKVFFSANDGVNGVELWVTDGTSTGTQLVKDISVGTNSSSPGFFAELNGKLLFSANEGGPYFQYELWVSDGTSAGTMILKDINPEGNSSLPYNLTKVGSEIYFTATNGTVGRELWKTDGTNAGTVLVKDINLTSTDTDNFTFPNNTSNRVFIELNGQLFFLANAGPEGIELWKSNGTAAGTVLIKDFVTGPQSSNYRTFFIQNNNLYFIVNDDTGKFNCWKTDGTTSGTVKVADINPSLEIENITPILQSASTNELYFVAYNAITGYELYKTNGTTVSFLKDIATENHVDYYSNLQYKAGINDHVIFDYNNNKQGVELWTTQGTSASTSLLLDQNLYPTTSLNYSNDFYSNSSEIRNLVKLGNYIYFYYNNASSSNKIWRTDGVTTELWYTNPNGSSIRMMTATEDKLRWTTNNSVLYESDGTTVNQITTLPSGYTYDNTMYNLNGISFFQYYSYTNGNELWKTDGTAAGTEILKEINAGTSSSNFGNEFRKVGNKMYFSVNNNTNGYELWVTDGTSTGTFMVKDIQSGGGSSYPSLLTNFNDNLLIFSANNGTNGYELWKSDGTAAGTVMIADLDPFGSSYPDGDNDDGFAVLNNKVYFRAYSSSTGSGLYSTDGTTINFIKGVSNINQIIVHENQLYFGGSSISGNYDYELWKSDGTALGTVMAKNINPSGSSSPYNLFSYNGKLYFMANDGVHGEEPWVLTACSDSLNIATTQSGPVHYKASRVIVGQTANTIASGSNVTYDAGKYVLLKEGFTTENGSVFLAQIGGCGSSVTTNAISSTTTTPSKPKYNAAALQYFQDQQEMPSIEDFIRYSENDSLTIVWDQFNKKKQELVVEEQRYTRELNQLKSISSKTISSGQQATSVETTYLKEQEVLQAKAKNQNYTYLIVPVRDKNGTKTGHELIISQEGKIYKTLLKI